MGSETPSISADIDIDEDKLDQEASKRAEERRKLLSQYKQTTPSSYSQKKKRKNKNHNNKNDENDDNISLSTLSTHSDDENMNVQQAEDSDDDDFGLYNVSYDDIQNTVNEKEESESLSQSQSADIELLSSQSSKSSMDSIHSSKKKRRKRKRNELSDTDDDDLELLSSPHRKRRKKNKKRKKQKNNLQRRDTNESFNIFDEISISDNDLDINQDKELNNLMNGTSMNLIDEKFDGLLTQIHAPLPSDNDNDINFDIPPIVSSNILQNEVSDKDEEEENEDEDEKNDLVHYYMNKPPPKQEKKLKIQMRISQQFGTIIDPLQKKFKHRITLSFDGEEIQNDWTPQYLIDEFDIEEGDLIDASYG